MTSLEERLKKTSYHWLFGLRESKMPCKPNLWTKIQAMQPRELILLRQQQAKIQQKFWFVNSSVKIPRLRSLF